MLIDTVKQMEIFFSTHCNKNGSPGIPDCSSCRHNKFKGCTNPDNPINKIMVEIENRVQHAAH